MEIEYIDDDIFNQLMDLPISDTVIPSFKPIPPCTAIKSIFKPVESNKATDICSEKDDCVFTSPSKSSIVKIEVTHSKLPRAQRSMSDFFSQRGNNVMQRGKQVPVEVCDPDCYPAFDHSIKGEWVYPINMPKRDYQYKIIQSCLVKNTLVCLPTGLGKTFVASVVMYNYNRWFPTGLILFTTPTRPLTSQQMQSCFEVVGMKPDDIYEMTGQTPASVRAKIWPTKRFIFLTPHILVNDLASGLLDPRRIVLIILDEAHHATGNYPYVTAIHEISKLNKRFRVVGLSATPGSGLSELTKMVENLNIAAIELRTDVSLDVEPYVHNRVEETVTVKPSLEMTLLCEKMEALISTYIKSLARCGVHIPGEVKNIGSYAIVLARERNHKLANKNPATQGRISMDLTVASKLVMAYESLLKHDMSVFVEKLSDVFEGPKSEYKSYLELKRNPIFIDVRKSYIDPYRLVNKSLPVTSPFMVHPKMIVLENRLSAHFNDCIARGESTRVIIFTILRASVTSIVEQLKINPVFKPSEFVGKSPSTQTSNLKKESTLADNCDLNESKNQRTNNRGGSAQSKQLAILEKFKQGEYNILVSTSIGEEGLDIGDVDLIVCYDSIGSTTRLTQRIGRTGRKRAGKILSIVMEGREADKLVQSKGAVKAIPSAMKININKLPFYKFNQEMIPHQYTLVSREVFITATQYNRDEILNTKPKRAAKEGDKKKRIKKMIIMDEHDMDNTVKSIHSSSSLSDVSQFAGFQKATLKKSIFSSSPSPSPSPSMNLSINNDAIDTLKDYNTTGASNSVLDKIIQEQDIDYLFDDSLFLGITDFDLIPGKTMGGNISNTSLTNSSRQLMQGLSLRSNSTTPEVNKERYDLIDLGLDSHSSGDSHVKKLEFRNLPQRQLIRQKRTVSKYNQFVDDIADEASESNESMIDESEEDVRQGIKREQRREAGVYVTDSDGMEGMEEMDKAQREEYLCLIDSFINDNSQSVAYSQADLVPYDAINISLDNAQDLLRTPINVQRTVSRLHDIQDTPGAQYGHDDNSYFDPDSSDNSFIVRETDSESNTPQYTANENSSIVVDSDFEARVEFERTTKKESLTTRAEALALLKLKRIQKRGY